jgi:adenosylmethionine-8-amino-7-oxononanoate aminotransferase
MAGVFSGYTYSGHPVGAAAALAALAEMKRLDVASNAAARGAEMLAGLQGLKERHALVGDARGKGLMCCIELVADRETKAPASKEAVAKVYETAYAHGAMVRTSATNVIISPPLILSSADVQTIVSALDAGLTAASA